MLESLSRNISKPIKFLRSLYKAYRSLWYGRKKHIYSGVLDHIQGRNRWYFQYNDLWEEIPSIIKTLVNKSAENTEDRTSSTKGTTAIICIFNRMSGFYETRNEMISITHENEEKCTIVWIALGSVENTTWAEGLGMGYSRTQNWEQGGEWNKEGKKDNTRKLYEVVYTESS